MSSCDIVNTYFQFSSNIGGGDKSILMGSNIDVDNYEQAWAQTIKDVPTTTSRSIYPLEKLPVFKDLSLDASIDSFINIATPEEIKIDEEQDLCNLIKEGAVTCFADIDPNGSIILRHQHDLTSFVTVLISVLTIIIMTENVLG